MLAMSARDRSCAAGIGVPGTPSAIAWPIAESLRSACHGNVPIGGGAVVSSRTNAPSLAPAAPWQLAQRWK